MPIAPTVAVAPLAVPADVPVVVAASAADRIAPPPPGPPVAVPVPVVAERTLANGLRVAVASRHDVPLIAAVLVTGGGSAADPAGRAGTAELMATLLTKGTATRSATQIAHEVEALGGGLAAGAGWDGTTLSLSVKADRLVPALAVMADVARHPKFAPDEIARARTQAIDDATVALSDPRALARMTATKAVFGDTLYGHVASGTVRSLKAITRADIATAYALGADPHRATLIFTGDIDLDRAVALATTAFGDWKAPDGIATRHGPGGMPYPAPRTIVVDLPDAAQASVVVARPGLARSDERYYPAIVANAALGGGFSSRLNSEIRVKRGLAYGASSGLDPRLGVGSLTAATATKNESAPEVAGLIAAEMRRLATRARRRARTDDPESGADRQLRRAGRDRRGPRRAARRPRHRRRAAERAGGVLDEGQRGDGGRRDARRGVAVRSGEREHDRRRRREDLPAGVRQGGDEGRGDPGGEARSGCAAAAVIGVFSPRELDHAPARELHNGGWTPHAETPDRARSIVAALPPLVPAVDHGRAPLQAVHTGEYLDFLEHAHGLWRAAGRDGDAIPYVWPVAHRRPLRLSRIDALLGRFSFDAATPVAEGTWDAAYWGAQAALTALDRVLDGEPAAFALCRPPGHHAGADYFGGYCYLNNAAVVARAAQAAGRGRVAILDVDYHHGNGTQDIFWDDASVLYASLHADPATDYPFFWGHADEVGAGAGAGTTLNLPLPQGTGIGPYLAALDVALAAVARFGAELLVVSFGADTFAGDPISGFALATDDFPAVAARIAGLGLPAVVVMEGGYATAELGANVAAFLSGF